MKLSRRERHMLIGGAILAALVVFMTWIIVPLSRKWIELGDQLAPRLMRLDAVQSRAEEHGKLLARRARLSRQVGSLLGLQLAEDPEKKPTGTPAESSGDPSMAPDTAQAAKAGVRSLEVDLEEIAKKSGAKIKLFTAMRAQRHAERLRYFKTIGLHVEAEGNAESLMKMLYSLEKGARFIRIDSLKIHQDLKKPGALSVTMDIGAYAPADET